MKIIDYFLNDFDWLESIGLGKKYAHVLFGDSRCCLA